jgi:hypothetical protein
MQRISGHYRDVFKMMLGLGGLTRLRSIQQLILFSFFLQLLEQICKFFNFPLAILMIGFGVFLFFFSRNQFYNVMN